MAGIDQRDIIFKVATRITVLCHGTVLAEGSPREIADNPRVREVYLGSKDPLGRKG